MESEQRRVEARSEKWERETKAKREREKKRKSGGGDRGLDREC